MANYPMRLAWLRVYLDEEEALPIDRMPSAYGFNLFTGLLKALPMVRAGKSATASWLSDPWRIDLSGDPDRDVVILTVHLPEHIAPLDKVSVPLSSFTREVFRICRKWLRYINEVYSEETEDPKLGEEYRRFRQLLLDAERAAK
jgi:hypothetical protein